MWRFKIQKGCKPHNIDDNLFRDVEAFEEEEGDDLGDYDLSTYEDDDV